MFSAYLNLPGILYVVLLGPIFEEIIFRGAILRSLQTFGNNFAIVVSSILFGLYHLILFQGTFAFFVGLLLGYCALRFSIKWAMLLHIANNAVSMSFMYFGVEPILIVGCYFLFLALGLVAGMLGVQQFQQQLREGKPPSLSPVAAVAFGQPDSRPVSAQYGQPLASVPGQSAGQPMGQPRLTGQLAGQPQSQPQPQPMGYQQVAERARPFAIAFSSPWLIVALTLAFLISLMTMVLL
jgi:hypothetical protein